MLNAAPLASTTREYLWFYGRWLLVFSSAASEETWQEPVDAA